MFGLPSNLKFAFQEPEPEPIDGEPEELFDFKVDEKGNINPPSFAMQCVRGDKGFGDELVAYSIFKKEDPDRAVIQEKLLSKGFDNPKEDRAIGAILGMAIGDSLGAPLEFSEVRYGSRIISGFDHTYGGKFRLKPGQWTDDTSMGLTMADSLLINQGFNPADIMHRFILWWNFGYCNAFHNDVKRGNKRSCGLGGNIFLSFRQFYFNGQPYTTAGDKDTSGNGSIMRMCPVPLFYHDDYAKALEISRLQSLTTHQGDEAAECARAMAHVILKAMAGGGKAVLATLGEDFKTDLKSVNCLIKSLQEDATPGRNWDLADRNWNWKDSNFKYSEARAKKDPGYVGGYCMDAFSMALHCIWTTDSFSEAVLKAANLCGDSDTVAAITGQMAGAIYGASSIPKDWIQKVQQWDDGDIALRGYKLFHHRKP